MLFTPPEPTLAEQEVAAHYRRFRDEFLAWAWKHTRTERRSRRMSSWREGHVIDPRHKVPDRGRAAIHEDLVYLNL